VGVGDFWIKGGEDGGGVVEWVYGRRKKMGERGVKSDLKAGHKRPKSEYV
jgi:hypothetical protein